MPQSTLNPSLTNEDVADLRAQGLNDFQIAHAQINSAPVPQSSSNGVIAPTLKAHAGGILGGGAGAIGGGLIGAAAGSEFPVVGNIVGGLIGALGGGYAGQKAQQAIESPETYQSQQQAADTAAQQHPIEAGATDILASGLASGGIPNPVAGFKGITNLIGRLGGKALSKEGANVAINSLVNPALNTGIGLATGQGLPSLGDIASQVAGGALFGSSWLPHHLGETQDVTDKRGTELPPEEPPKLIGDFGQMYPTVTPGQKKMAAKVADRKDIPLSWGTSGYMGSEVPAMGSGIGNTLPFQEGDHITLQRDSGDLNGHVVEVGKNGIPSIIDENGKPVELSNEEQKQFALWIEKTQGEQNANTIEKPVENVRNEEARPPAQVAEGKPSGLQQTAGTQESKGSEPTQQQKVAGRLFKDNKHDVYYHIVHDPSDTEAPFKRFELEKNEAGKYEVIDAAHFATEDAALPKGYAKEVEPKTLEGQRLNAPPRDKPLPYGLWLSPSGDIHEVGGGRYYPNDEGHSDVAKRILKKQYGEESANDPISPSQKLLDKGWLRVVHSVPNNLLMAESGPRATMSNSQRRALKNYSIEHGVESYHLPAGYRREEWIHRLEASQTHDLSHYVLNSNSLTQHILDNKATVGSVLHSLANEPNHPFKELAGHLLEIADKAGLNVKILPSKEGSYYGLHGDEIRLNTGDAGDSRTVLHEIIHALTARKLPTFKKLGKLHLDELEHYLKTGDNEALKDLIHSYIETVKSQGWFKKVFGISEVNAEGFITRGLANASNEVQKQGLPYGIGSLHEFMAEALSNEKFQKLLESIPTNDGRTMWQKIVDSVRRILGLSPKEGTMLNRVLRTTSEIAHQERPLDVEHYQPYKVNAEYDWKKEFLEDAQEGRLSNDLDKHSSPYLSIALSQVAKGIPSNDVLKYLKLNLKNLTRPINKQVEERFGNNNVRYVNKEVQVPVELDNRLKEFLSKVEGKESLEDWLKIAKDSGITVKGRSNPNDDLSKGWADYTKLNAPPKQQPKDLPPDAYMGKVGRLTRAAIDKLKDVGTKPAKVLADAAKKALNKKDELLGKLKNPVLQSGKKLSTFDRKKINEVFGKELETNRSFKHLLTTPAQRDFYNIAREKLNALDLHRIAIGEPIKSLIRTGNKTFYAKGLVRQNPHNWPQMPNMKVMNQYRSGKDTTDLDKEFHDYNQKVLGMSPQESLERVDNFKKTLLTNPLAHNISRQDYFNASRKEAGAPLPPSFRELDPVRNLERYFERASSDASHYEHMEKDPEVLAALGQQKDAWGKDVPQIYGHGISGMTEAQNVLNHWIGERRNPASEVEEKLSSFLTALFISGPPLEIHKIASNMVGAWSLTNPVTFTKALGHAISNINEGYRSAVKGNVMKLNSVSSYKMFDATATAAERLQSMGRLVRKVATLNDLTTKFNVSLMQNMMEVIVPSKLLRANNGDVSQMKFLKNLDPNYVQGRQYSGAELQQLASLAANYLHGTGDIRSLPAWMLNDSEFSGFFSLAHWSIAKTNAFMKDIWEPATRGDFKPLLTGAFGAAIGGYLIKELRQDIQGKKNPIPSLNEIASSDRGLQGNSGLLLYNTLAAFQYAGFGGLLSQVAKYPFDFAYKNEPQGATFPLDEVTSDLAGTVKEVSEALANDPNVSFPDMVVAVANHILSTDIQLSRLALNRGIDTGLISGLPAEKKALSDKLGQLRRFDMTEGLPYNDIDSSQNPYMNLEQKRFKLNENPQEAASMVPELLSNIIAKYHNNPDVMMQKLRGLKQNEYSTFPSMENMPLSFAKYLGYLQREEGPEGAQQALMDYMQHKAINQAKASVVP